ncbi:MAG: PAS domain-containing protein, partial [Gammaproteobacteria bacterium]|nr:PAS domain-containing protein [Gammaproteobacteria bacterium]
MNTRKSVSTDLKKTKKTLLEEIASLREKLEKFEAVSSAREDRLHTLSAVFKLGFWEWDLVKNEAAYYSEEMANIYGVSLSELYDLFKVEEDYYSCIHPEDLVDFKNNMTRCAAPGQLPGEGAVFDYRII